MRISLGKVNNMNSMCPKCKQSLVVITDAYDQSLNELICPTCAHYESTSEAFRQCPEMYSDIGPSVIGNLNKELSEFGLTLLSTQQWFQNEETFAKRNFTALDPKRQLYRTQPQNP